MASWPKLSMALRILACVLVFPLAIVLLAALAIGAVLVVALAWVFGTKITITKNNAKVGYVRWLTYYPKAQ